MKRLLGIALMLSVVTGCPTGSVGDLVRPVVPDAAGAIDGEPITCRDVAEHASPLVVDWDMDSRTRLELTMRNGVAVVAYDCKELRLLDRCRLRGSYRFAGVTRKEEVVQLDNRDEIHANLPLNGVKLGAGLERGSSLDLALVIVGKASTSVVRARRDALEGDCDGATHFVRAATLGAFAMAAGASGEARALVDIFGVETGGSSSAKQERGRKDGDLAACQTASHDATAAPTRCGALLRVDLYPFGDKDEVRASAAAKPAAGNASAAQVSRPSCPAGMARAKNKCTIAKDQHSCAAGNRASCEQSCQLGVAEGCVKAAGMYRYGVGVKQERNVENELLERACKLGAENACRTLALNLVNCPWRKTCDKNPERSKKLLEASCGRGHALACQELGSRGVYKLGKLQQLDLHVRACDLGEGWSCQHAATMLLEGEPKKADSTRAISMLRRSCDGDYKKSCTVLGSTLWSGNGNIEPDRPAAMDAFVKACALGDTPWCVKGAKRLIAGPEGLDRDVVRAKKMLRRACFAKMPHGQACAMLAQRLGSEDPHDQEPARKLWVRACEYSSYNLAKACEMAAGLTETRSRRVAAAKCDAGDPAACALTREMMLARGCSHFDRASCRKLEQVAPKRWAAEMMHQCRIHATEDEPACRALIDKGIALPNGVKLRTKKPSGQNRYAGPL